MKIQFKNGKISNARGDVGALFVDAGLATEVFDTVTPAFVVKQPTAWRVGLANGTPFIAAKCPNQPCASQVSKHAAQGPNAAAQPYWHCGIKGGELCPPEIEDQFKKLLKKAKPVQEKIYDDAIPDDAL